MSSLESMKWTDVLVFSLFLLIINSCLLSSARNKNVTITKIGEYPISSTLFDVQVVDDTAYIADYSNNEFYILDVSDSTNPISLANYSVHLPHYFEVVNGIAYIAAWDQGVQIVNVSDSSNPEKICEYNPDTTGYQTIFGNYMLVGFTHSTQIVDISDPANPDWISTFNVGFSVMGSFIDENIVYLLSWNWTTENSWVNVFDISDLENPVELGYFDDGDIVVDICVRNDIVFLANEIFGLMIVDFSDYSNPALLNTYDTQGIVSGLQLEGDILFIANGNKGVSIVDISDVMEPITLAEFWDSGTSTELDYQNNLIYVVDNWEGFEILQIEGLTIDKTSGFVFWSVLIATPLLLLKIRKRRKRRE
jgi:hypothetical protein